jgi:FkbM family methyltransferase
MLFYHLGGSGVLVEPNPKLADLLRRKRGKRDTIVSAGVSASESGNMPFFVMDPDVLSTFSKSEADAYVASGYRLVEQLDVSVVSINAIVEEYFPRATVPPHVCSIDVEGVDIEIVQSLDWERFRPAVCCLETWDMAKKRDRAQLVDTMLAADYRVFARVGPNTIFVRNSIYPKAS